MMIPIIYASIATMLMVLDHLYHHPNQFKKIGSTIHARDDIKKYHQAFKILRVKKYDNLFGLFPFIANYLYILAAITAFRLVPIIPVQFLLIIFVSGRFKNLQEIGHQALHGAVCKSRSLGLWLTNILFQYPLFKPDVMFRFKSHVLEHHPYVNIPSRDPNLDDFKLIGLQEGISKLKFWICVFHPLTPSGIILTLQGCFRNMFYRNDGPFRLVLRLVVVASIITLFILTDYVLEMFLLYLLPMLIFYPLLSWISQVAEHRWFLKSTPSQTRLEREMEFGRPTRYTGIIGYIIKHNIFPFGDSYHLAHSLFPYVRWNYLPMIDNILSKNNFWDYNKNMTVGLFYNSNGTHSAISELEERLVKK